MLSRSTRWELGTVDDDRGRVVFSNVTINKDKHTVAQFYLLGKQRPEMAATPQRLTVTAIKLKTTVTPASRVFCQQQVAWTAIFSDSWICRTGICRTGKWRSRTRTNICIQSYTGIVWGNWSNSEMAVVNSHQLGLDICDWNSETETVTQTKTLGHMTYCGHCMISFVYHVFNKYNCKCGIIYVVRFVLKTITCRTH